ncbi:hypothetical protein ELI_0995 [Eubacterium callanderi]|uniref:Uncharacterized protein n=1 Tax=Eubacterium callanderi TaxID=53442 RepID=E3GKH9_9FIRM|nr:hypothetical protein ELI_0995 [Eubacterium callanderi]
MWAPFIMVGGGGSVFIFWEKDNEKV